jgi:hypothetical protein
MWRRFCPSRIFGSVSAGDAVSRVSANCEHETLASSSIRSGAFEFRSWDEHEACIGKYRPIVPCEALAPLQAPGFLHRWFLHRVAQQTEDWAGLVFSGFDRCPPSPRPSGGSSVTLPGGPGTSLPGPFAFIVQVLINDHRNPR